MQIALLGGTGDIGEGLAVRWARDTDHAITIGSRDPDKAARRVDDYEERLAAHGASGDLTGASNPDAAADADVVVLSVPAYYLADTIESVADELGDAILVSPAVGMKRDDSGVHYNPPGVGSVSELAAQSAPDDVPIVGAFHNLAAGRLATLDADIDWDVPVIGDDEAAKETIMELATDIEGLRALDAGGLANASEVESLTALLVNLAANNDGLHDLGVRFQ